MCRNILEYVVSVAICWNGLEYVGMLECVVVMECVGVCWNMLECVGVFVPWKPWQPRLSKLAIILYLHKCKRL